MGVQPGLDGIDWVHRLTRWRMVFVGWQLGTRQKGDPESDALRDHREMTMLLRAEFNALTRLLIEKKVFTQAEFTIALQEESKHLCEQYEKRFPGFRAADTGMDMEVAIARETTKGWKP